MRFWTSAQQCRGIVSARIRAGGLRLAGVWLLILANAASNADLPAGFEAARYRHPKLGDVGYRIWKPGPLEAGKTYPIVLFLHASGTMGDDNERQIAMLKGLATTDQLGTRLCFLVAPQLKIGMRFTTDDWRSPGYRTLPDAADAELLAAGLLDDLMRQYPIDPDRVYLAGIGAGATCAADLLVRRPGRYAAAFLIGANADRGQAARISHVPLWMLHSRKDEALGSKAAQSLQDSLAVGERSKAEMRNESIAEVARLCFADCAWLDWLLQQDREQNEWVVRLQEIEDGLEGQLVVVQADVRNIPEKDEQVRIEKELANGTMSLEQFDKLPKKKGYAVLLGQTGKRLDAWFAAGSMPIERFRALQPKDRVRVKGVVERFAGGLRLRVEKPEWWSVIKAAPEPQKKENK